MARQNKGISQHFLSFEFPLNQVEPRVEKAAALGATLVAGQLNWDA